jgi:hypothetical protein
MEESMARLTGYIRLPDPVREHTLAAAHQQATRAAAQYARLLAAEAGIAARAVHPAVARLVFRLTEDITGPSATLVAAYTADGRRLWHRDTDDEWPDESLVTDHLAAAAEWDDNAFTDTDSDGEYLYEHHLDD